MFVVNFSATPAQVSEALGLIPILCASTERWAALLRAMDGILKKLSSESDIPTTELLEAATAITGDSASTSQGIVTVRIDIVSFTLGQGTFVTVLHEPRVTGLLAIHARVTKHQASCIASSLIGNDVFFTAVPSFHGKPEPKEDLPPSLSHQPKDTLTRKVIADLSKAFETLGDQNDFYREFYELVHPWLSDLFLYSSAFLTIHEKWNRRDWVMEGIVAHVKDVIAKVRKAIEERGDIHIFVD